MRRLLIALLVVPLAAFASPVPGAGADPEGIQFFEAKIRHGGHPVLTMCASNAKTASDPAGNRKLDKQKSTGRIDGLVAMTMAIGKAASGLSTRSVYEGDDRPDGLLVI